MQDKLIARAKELLAEGKVQKVVGWKKGLFEDDITPAVFTTAEELDKDFVFNKYCKANLSKYLVKITREIEIAKSTTRMNNTMVVVYNLFSFIETCHHIASVASMS